MQEGLIKPIFFQTSVSLWKNRVGGIKFMTFPNSWFFTMILCNLEIVLPGTLRQYQGLVKGSELCLNPYFLAGCRSTLSMSKIKVKIFETKYCSFCNTLGNTLEPFTIRVKLDNFFILKCSEKIPCTNHVHKIYYLGPHFHSLIFSRCIFTQHLQQVV